MHLRVLGLVLAMAVLAVAPASADESQVYRPVRTPPTCEVSTSGATNCDDYLVYYSVPIVQDNFGFFMWRGSVVTLRDATGLPVHFKVVSHPNFGQESVNCAGSCQPRLNSYYNLVLIAPYSFTAIEISQYPTAGFATTGTIVVT